MQYFRTSYLVLACLLAATAAQADQLYVWNGLTLSPIAAPPKPGQCDHWAIALFSDGAAKIMGTEWGATTGATPEIVQQKLQQALEISEKANAALHHAGNHLMSYTNTLGPICVIKRSAYQAATAGSPEFEESRAERIVSSTLDSLDEAVETYDKYEKYLKRHPTSEFRKQGEGELREYIKQLKEIFDKVAHLRDQLNFTNSANYAEIHQDLSAAERALDIANGERLSALGLAQSALNGDVKDSEPKKKSAPKLDEEIPLQAGVTREPSRGPTPNSADTSWSGKSESVMVFNHPGQSTVTIAGDALALTTSYSIPEVGNTITDTQRLPFQQIQTSYYYGNKTADLVVVGGAEIQEFNTWHNMHRTSMGGGQVLIAFDNEADCQNFLAYVATRAGH